MGERFKTQLLTVLGGIEIEKKKIYIYLCKN